MTYQGLPGFSAATQRRKLDFELEPDLERLIDQWLEEGLVDPNADFSALLRLASRVGSSASMPSQVAHWFRACFRRSGDWFDDEWTEPAFSDEWYSQVSADPRSALIADRIMREELAADRDGVCQDFCEQIERIAPVASAAYIEALLKLVGRYSDNNLSAISSGAVRDLDGYEVVIEAALDDVKRDRAYWVEKHDEWLDIVDGHYDAGAGRRFMSRKIN